jgi:hypothetical protein
MNDFFAKQHLFLKFLLLISAIIYLSKANLTAIGILLIFQLIFFLPKPKLIENWLQTCLKLAPFLTAFFILGIIFNSDFLVQLRTAAKILMLIMFSVYLVQTTNLNNFLADISPVFGKESPFVLYIAATAEFIPTFVNNFRKIQGNIFHSALQAITNTAQNTHLIKKNIDQKLSHPLPVRFWTNKANFILLLYIILINIGSWKWL